MGFSSSKNTPTKAARASTVALALAVLLIRGGERVGLMDLKTPARSGQIQVLRLAEVLTGAESSDFGVPDVRGMVSNSRAAMVSDFLGDLEPVERAMTTAADRGVKGAILQVLDPQEEAFPFAGRTVFESMGGGIAHETLEASDLRDRYLHRLAERKARLSDLAKLTGWQYHCHHTDAPATSALLWLYAAMERDH